MKGNQVDGTCSRIGEKRQDIGWKDGKEEDIWKTLVLMEE
jgi:hypothetical protein